MGRDAEVDAWFERYENPMKAVVERAREIVRAWYDSREDEDTAPARPARAAKPRSATKPRSAAKPPSTARAPRTARGRRTRS